MASQPSTPLWIRQFDDTKQAGARINALDYGRCGSPDCECGQPQQIPPTARGIVAAALSMIRWLRGGGQ